jgi:hypothetical protein
MNKKGNPGTLVAAHRGNTNAAKYGVHSLRLIEPRAAEIAEELTSSFEFTIVQRVAVEQVARFVAILEAIDRDLDERGLVDKRGEARYLLNHRARFSRQLDAWLAKIWPSIERQTAREQPTAPVGHSDYIAELQRIALGEDTTASARDRVAALKELMSIDSAPAAVSHVTINVHTDEEGNVTLGAGPEARQKDGIRLADMSVL